MTGGGAGVMRAVVALPGGAGTASEVSLARRYGTPVIAYTSDPRLVSVWPADVVRATSLDEIERFLREHLRDLD